MEESLYSDTLGRWNSIILSNGEKSILIITAYRIPGSSSKGIHTNQAQLSRKSR